MVVEIAGSNYALASLSLVVKLDAGRSTRSEMSCAIFYSAKQSANSLFNTRARNQAFGYQNFPES